MGNYGKWMSVVLMLSLIALASSQKEIHAKKGGSKGQSNSINSINSITSEEKSKVLPQSLIPGYQNSSQPFNVRFGKPPRVSQRFHFPALPAVYWTQHKRPAIPIWEEELSYGFGR